MTMRTATTALLAAATMLAGCNLAPKYERPAAPVPPSFPTGGAYPAAGTTGTTASLDWQAVFTDARLARVIEAALANNRDLRVAAANVAAARGQYRATRSALFPALIGQANVSVADSDGGGTSRSYQLGVGVSSFEIDLFGRVRNQSEAAFQSYLATEAGARATRLSLVAETASAWLTLAADRSLLDIASQTVESAGRTADISRRRRDAGIASGLDLQQAETVLATARADVASLTAQVAQDENALALLVGAQVAAADLPANLDDVAPLGEVPSGLDSSILLRRPDVVQAERNLLSANADIGAARAAFFPSISLTALAGVASTALSGLFSGDAFTWSVAPSATLPIFGGTNRGNLETAKADRDAALASYEKAIQTAFKEVSDALATRGTIDAQLAAQGDLVAAARKSYELSEARYRGGIDTFLNALDAQRTLYSAQKTLVNTRLTEADNLVTLYRVLGGDQRF